MRPVAVLVVLLVAGPALGQDTCTWPDWGPECGLPACPDCARVTCVEELSQEDCPAGQYTTRGVSPL